MPKWWARVHSVSAALWNANSMTLQYIFPKWRRERFTKGPISNIWIIHISLVQRCRQMECLIISTSFGSRLTLITFFCKLCSVLLLCKCFLNSDNNWARNKLNHAQYLRRFGTLVYHENDILYTICTYIIHVDVVKDNEKWTIPLKYNII